MFIYSVNLCYFYVKEVLFVVEVEVLFKIIKMYDVRDQSNWVVCKYIKI